MCYNYVNDLCDDSFITDEQYELLTKQLNKSLDCGCEYSVVANACNEKEMSKKVEFDVEEIKRYADAINEAWEEIDPYWQSALYTIDSRSVAKYLTKVDDLLDFLSDKRYPEDNTDIKGNEPVIVDPEYVIRATMRLPNYMRATSGRYPWG